MKDLFGRRAILLMRRQAKQTASVFEAKGRFALFVDVEPVNDKHAAVVRHRGLRYSGDASRAGTCIE